MSALTGVPDLAATRNSHPKRGNDRGAPGPGPAAPRQQVDGNPGAARQLTHWSPLGSWRPEAGGEGEPARDPIPRDLARPTPPRHPSQAAGPRGSLGQTLTGCYELEDRP